MNKKNPVSTITILIIVGIFSFYTYNNWNKKLKNLEQYKDNTVGTLINCQSYRKHKKTRHVITMRYEIQNKKYEITKEYNTYMKYANCPSPGNSNGTVRMNILYDSKNPESVIPEYVLEYQKDRFQFQKNLTICVMIFILIATITYYKRNAYKID